jgi:hypothetical protein
VKLTTTVTHDIDFTVCYFERTEGGMDYNTFGKTVNDLPSAIRILELAKALSPEHGWKIVADVTTQLGSKTT